MAAYGCYVRLRLGSELAPVRFHGNVWHRCQVVVGAPAALVLCPYRHEWTRVVRRVRRDGSVYYSESYARR